MNVKTTEVPRYGQSRFARGGVVSPFGAEDRY